MVHASTRTRLRQAAVKKRRVMTGSPRYDRRYLQGDVGGAREPLQVQRAQEVEEPDLTPRGRGGHHATREPPKPAYDRVVL